VQAETDHLHQVRRADEAKNQMTSQSPIHSDNAVEKVDLLLQV
jgi:hypothetical protein